MVIECDQEIPADALKWLERMEGIFESNLSEFTVNKFFCICETQIYVMNVV